MRLSGVAGCIVSSGLVQRQLLRRKLQHIQRVTCHGVLITRVVHDDFNDTEGECDLLKQNIVRASSRFIAILSDTDYARFVVSMDRH